MCFGREAEAAAAWWSGESERGGETDQQPLLNDPARTWSAAG